ncbi:MAG: hypothetical protein IJV00_02790 [Clostridia bacterium]|nr:hypothetical protein [Clostridia bacterium]
MTGIETPEVIIPINLDANRTSRADAARVIRRQHDRFGFASFCLCLPVGGRRNTGYPPREYFSEKAELFKELKKELSPEGIRLGWCNCLTIKSGDSEGFEKIVKQDGSLHPFANCPLGETFRKRFTEDTALFCETAEPEFVFFEDDFSLSAADGCFCEKHIKLFCERFGTEISREELVLILNRRETRDVETIRKWREFTKDTLVDFSRAIREKVDEKTPRIPIGLWQSGCDVLDGCCTEDVCRALAGKNNVPFARLAGSDYSGLKANSIPRILYHAVGFKQHVKDFLCYAEADAFPHTRFFTSAKSIVALTGTAYSCGFDGAVLHTLQQLDDPDEDEGFSREYARERKRFDPLCSLVKNCRIKGVQIPYDPFAYSLNDRWHAPPLWTESVSRFGIPFTTQEAPVRFWDAAAALRFDGEQIIRALSGGLFLDGNAAKILCDRGYGKYLGVRVGEDVSKNRKLRFDLAAREIICEGFTKEDRKRNMFTAWMYSPGGNGIARELVSEGAKAVTGIYDCENRFITNGMTFFKNSLGGSVVVMGMTLENNRSGSLFNYRRKRIIQTLMKRCADFVFYECEAPDVSVVENEASDGADFRELITVTNLCGDTLGRIVLHVPETFKNVTDVEYLDRGGRRKKAVFVTEGDRLIVRRSLSSCEQACLLIS